MNSLHVANGGQKRRLPLWMSGDQVQSKSQIGNLNCTKDDDKGCQEDVERVTKGSRRPKTKSQKKETDDGKVKLKESSSTVLVKCRERKKTKREVVIQDADCIEDGGRKKRKCRQKTETYFESETEEDVEPFLEDGEAEDLTVDDLMSIAKEYVEEDHDAQVLMPSKQRDTAENRSQHVEVESDAPVLVSPKRRDAAEYRSHNDAQSDSFIGVTDTSRRLFESQGTSSYSTTENPTSDTGVPVTLSSNPVQAMLDVLLGPSLKKTQELEKERRLNSQNTSFTYELEKQHSSVDVAEEPIVVVAKKKSSLKDKVAMFLD
ncbi:OLC1v1004908C1 [Oldenlandia corymbosa var. corymbosa]|uniref:OLC1v1004908C1 n=1 Tax=Oldenlandia corymbosa var. corymbosa TaxID=529605 RepID=A0AAV1DFU1_OLDCO|nr:OLC1v1004908C1 [Oldenlandia corymbosa var. corymbosa]